MSTTTTTTTTTTPIATILANLTEREREIAASMFLRTMEACAEALERKDDPLPSAYSATRAGDLLEGLTAVAVGHDEAFSPDSYHGAIDFLRLALAGGSVGTISQWLIAGVIRGDEDVEDNLVELRKAMRRLAA